MENNSSLGITGEIESVPHAKRIVYIAVGATLALQLGWFFHGSLIGIGVTIPLAFILIFFKTRIASIALFIWTFLNTAWILLFTIPMLIDGRYLRAYLLVFCFVILWLQYRAIRATIWIDENKSDKNLQAIQDVFE